MAIGGLGAAVLIAVAALCTGCGSLAYYRQAVVGHLDLMTRARPVAEWLADPATDPALAERLRLTQRLRDFAVDELKLPDNRSYRAYADLRRGAAVWNVVAAPELSLTLKTWCFAIVGCVGYRGYYERTDADALAASLKAEGFDVAVYGVPAYSTLGWTDWFGGDPLLSTFIEWPQGELARLIFHELAHQVAYAAGDTAFNESFATAVEQLGVRRWLAEHAAPAARDEYLSFNRRRRELRVLTLQARAALETVYTDASLDDAAKRAGKARVLDTLRADYERLKTERWGGFSGYDRWMSQMNNALLGVQAAYEDWVPEFERLFDHQGGDFKRFYAAVRHLSELPQAERDAALKAL